MRHDRLKVQHVITGLSGGGAQSALYTLVQNTSGSIAHSIIALKDDAPMGAAIRALGIPVRTLGRGARVAAEAVRALHQAPPDLIHTWLYHADLVGGVAARALGIPCLWHLHVSNLDPVGLRLSTRGIARICLHASHILPTRIVACSESTRRVHAKAGYAEMEVIDNGVDTEKFQRTRESILPAGPFTIGMVARFDPQKDIRTFVEAAKQFRRAAARFVLVGDGMGVDNQELSAWIGQTSGFVRFPYRPDVEALYPAFDVFTLSSVSEASSMSVLEAMSCGAIPVVTDVGDARRIIGDVGIVVPPRDPASLARAWERMFDETPSERQARSLRARVRVSERFSAQENARRFEILYRDLA